MEALLNFKSSTINRAIIMGFLFAIKTQHIGLSQHSKYATFHEYLQEIIQHFNDKLTEDQ